MNYIKNMKCVVFLSVVFFLCIFIRVFLFEIYYVPSGSMENCLYEGDVILVSKIHYGARLPLSLSDIPWMNLFARQSNVNSPIFSNNRIIGVSHIERGDIVVFNSPNTKNRYNVKRCIALPKDSLFISNDTVLVNGQSFVHNEHVKFKYNIIYKDREYPFSSVMKEFSIPYSETRYQKVSSNKEVYLTDSQKDKIIDKLGNTIELKHNSTLSYNQSLVIPYMGEVVSSLDSIPHEVIKYEKISKGCVIYQNYFFFLGDNREASIDSRYFGIIPENHIVGKAIFVLFSTNISKIMHEKRIFKYVS